MGHPSPPSPPRPQLRFPVAHERLPRGTLRPVPPPLSAPPIPLPAAPRRHAPTARTTTPGVPARLAFPAAR
jgi:hypothetical protein